MCKPKEAFFITEGNRAFWSHLLPHGIVALFRSESALPGAQAWNLKSCLIPLFSHTAKCIHLHLQSVYKMPPCLSASTACTCPSPSTSCLGHLTPSYCSALFTFVPLCPVLNPEWSCLSHSFTVLLKTPTASHLSQGKKQKAGTVLTRPHCFHPLTGWRHLAPPHLPSAPATLPFQGLCFVEPFPPGIHVAYSLTSCGTSLKGYFAGEVFPDHPKIPPLPQSVPIYLHFIPL